MGTGARGFAVEGGVKGDFSLSFNGSGAMDDLVTSGGVGAFPDNRLDRFWIGPDLGDDPVSTSAVVEPTNAISESEGFSLSFMMV